MQQINAAPSTGALDLCWCLLLTDAAEKSSGSTLVKQLCSEKEAVMYLGVHVARA